MTQNESPDTSIDITFEIPTLPMVARFGNCLGTLLERMGGFSDMLSVESILAEARRRTGLNDFGKGELRTPLTLLTQPDEDGLNVTFIGRRFQRRALIASLINRLLIEEELKAHPETLDEAIHRPIIVAGKGRSGTTFLQRLLSQEPGVRPLLAWEALHPAPAPHPRTHHRDPRINQTRRELRGPTLLFPGLRALHYSDATSPEECEWLLHNSFLVLGFLWKYPEYRRFNAWSRRQDKLSAYAYYKAQLQILQRNFPATPWVLKGNEHVDELSLKVVDERERRRTLLGMLRNQPPKPRCHPGERYATYVEAYHCEDGRDGG